VFQLGPWRDLLWRETRYPFAGDEILKIVNDKFMLGRLAGQAGLRVPWSITPRALASRGADGLSFPIVCKPLDGFGARGFGVLENRRELDRWLATFRFTGASLLQEFVPGPLLVWMGIRWDGRLRASFAFETAKTTPAFGGASVLRRSVIDRALDVQSARLLDFLDYDGFCTLDYIRREGTDHDYLIDFNPRFGTSLHAAALAGVSFPHCLLNLAMGRACDPPSYAAGIVSSSLTGHLGRIVRSCPRKPPVRTLLADAVRAFADTSSAEECFSKTPLPALMPVLNAFVKATPWLRRGSGTTIQHADDCHPETAVATRR
jgi:predicted ATP-grasp superfamily ATP-dependent carboligase